MFGYHEIFHVLVIVAAAVHFVAIAAFVLPKAWSYGIGMDLKTQKTDAEWRAELSPEQYEVLRRKGTERAFTGEYDDTKDPALPLCRAAARSSSAPTRSSIPARAGRASSSPQSLDSVDDRDGPSHGMVRTEVTCAACGGHLGHVFPDGPGRPASATASTRARSIWSAHDRRD